MKLVIVKVHGFVVDVKKKNLFWQNFVNNKKRSHSQSFNMQMFLCFYQSFMNQFLFKRMWGHGGVVKLYLRFVFLQEKHTQYLKSSQKKITKIIEKKNTKISDTGYVKLFTDMIISEVIVICFYKFVRFVFFQLNEILYLRLAT